MSGVTPSAWHRHMVPVRPHARLDLVKDQHHAGLVTDLPDLLEVALGGHNDPGLPLDGL